MTDFKGKIIIVTGAASGIGAAVARRLNAGSAAVCISDLHQDTAEKSTATLQGRVIAVAADVTNEDERALV